MCVCTRGSVECQVAKMTPFDDLDREASGGGVVRQAEKQLRNSTVRERLGEGSAVRWRTHTQLRV